MCQYTAVIPGIFTVCSQESSKQPPCNLIQEKEEGIPTRFRDFDFSWPRATSPKALRCLRWIGATRGRLLEVGTAWSGVTLWFGPKFPAFMGEIPLLKQGCGLLWQSWRLTQGHLVGKDLKVHQVQPLIMCIFCVPV